MDSTSIDDTVSRLCKIAEFEKKFTLFHPHIKAIHQRYFIWRYMIEELGFKLHSKNWIGISFSHMYKSLRKRISALLENKYQGYKTKWSNELAKETKEA